MYLPIFCRVIALGQSYDLWSMLGGVKVTIQQVYAALVLHSRTACERRRYLCNASSHWLCDCRTQALKCIQVVDCHPLLGQCQWSNHEGYLDGLVQERHNSSALALELRLSCINLSICKFSHYLTTTKWKHVLDAWKALCGSLPNWGMSKYGCMQ